MKEEICSLTSGSITLDARLMQQGSATGLIMCHPHPLFGGSMDNKVVTTVIRSAQRLGINTLRFNFRGVGNSDGEHDHGQGEQGDVLAAIDFAVQQGWQKIIVAGFSFGAGMACLALNHLADEMQQTVTQAILIAPAVHHFDAPNRLPAMIDVAVLMGDADEVVPFDEVDDWARRVVPTPEWITFQNTSHFFHGRLVDLAQTISDLLTDR